MEHAASDLTGHLLIAMPGMGDPRFDRAVIYICAHSPEGTMGLILNKPNPEVRFDDLLEHLKIDPPQRTGKVPVHIGGPVEMGRGFVLHSADYTNNDSTLEVNENFGMTATLDVLEDIAKGAGPRRSILALGYSGWGPGQLEDEIVANGWLTVAATETLVFDETGEAKWVRALEALGINPLMLSAVGGTA